MVINDKERFRLWQEYKDVENKSKMLKDVLQNPVELTKEDLDEHKKLTESVCADLMRLHNEIFGDEI